MRLYKLANHWDFQFPNQISHKNKGVFQHTYHVKLLSTEISRDLPSHFLNTLVDLVGRQQHSRIFLGNASIAHSAAPHSEKLISSIKTASPDLAAKASGTGNPRIQTIAPALSITGHNLRSAGRSSWLSRPGCNSSFTFFGDRVCAGKNLSPARQFLIVNSGANKAWFNKPELYRENSCSPAKVKIRARMVVPNSATATWPGIVRRYL